MRELDRIAIEVYSIPGIILMENAGIAVAQQAMKVLNNKPSKKVVILCGVGNNGGDGFVAARHLRNKGIPLDVFILGEPARIKGDARTNYDILLKLGVSITYIEEEKDVTAFEKALVNDSIIIDGIFGTGLHREVEGIIKEVIITTNNSGKEVIAIDIPSGVNGNDGKINGVAIQAAKTITFQLPKLGNILYPGRAYCGELMIKDIGIPQEAINSVQTKIQLITEDDITGILPQRRPDTHKGTYGKAFIIAGSPGMTGAAILASKAALRCGGGIVKVAVPQAQMDILENKSIEAISVSLEDLQGNKKEFIERLQTEDTVAIGPGCGQSDAFFDTLGTVINNTTVPIVIDADGLNVLAKNLNILKNSKAPCIITPHPGEMARLTGLSIEVINKERIKVTKDFSEKWGVITLLKGAATVIADPEGNVYINTTGNPGMATAGSGDVLTGMITGFLAQGISPIKATIIAAYLHGKAGDRGSVKLGQYSLMAGDIIKEIPCLIKEVLAEPLKKSNNT